MATGRRPPLLAHGPRLCGGGGRGRKAHHEARHRQDGGPLGLGGVVAGLLLMMGVFREGGLLLVLAGTVVGEAGFMFSNVSLTIAGTWARTGEDGRGLAAGLLNTSVQLGNAWGLGVVATLIAATSGPGVSAGGLEAGLLACAAFALLAMPIAFFGLPGAKPLQAPDDGA